MNFKNSIYGHPKVKTQLKEDQNYKCAYCETKFNGFFGYGVVEHFRPKAGYKQNKKDKLNRPGYYWLAYDWNNLLFSCDRCNNQANKGNLFPLKDENKRIKNHNSNKLKENISEVLLINPYFEDVKKHLGFREEIIFWKTEKGKQTIEILGLNKPDLQDKRREYIKTYEKNCFFENLTEQNKKELLRKIQLKLLDLIETAKKENIIIRTEKGQYFAMIKSYITKYNLKNAKK